MGKKSSSKVKNRNKKRRDAKKPPQKGTRMGASRFPLLGGEPLGPSLPAIHLDLHLRAGEDPWAVLGLPAGTSDVEAIRAAWRQRTLECPPEQDPDGARRLREARDRLVDPARALERLVGTVHLPDPAAWGMDAPVAVAGADVPALPRLAAQLVLHVLAEDLILAADAAAGGRAPIRGEQRRLF